MPVAARRRAGGGLPVLNAVRADGAVNYLRLGDAPGSKALLNSGVVPPGPFSRLARYLNPGDYQMGSPDSHNFAIVPKQIWGP